MGEFWYTLALFKKIERRQTSMDKEIAKKRRLLVTHALPYANGSLHLGHLVGTIQGDIWTRFQRLLGNDCLYISGSDCHGTPIMIQAEKQGISPDQLSANMTHEHETDFADFHIHFDNYYTTHSDENKELIKTIFERQLAGGNIKKRTITQLYDPTKNIFLPDRYVKGECPKCHAKDQYGDNCEKCGTTYAATDLINPYSTLSGAAPIEKESEHYFFRLDQFEIFLKDWTHEGRLQPEVAKKLDEWFQDGLKEWDISRDAPYFGFLIPNETNKYFYVWLDAPIGYMASFKNYCSKNPTVKFDDYWNEESDVELFHFIGKDIVYFHALFWPAVLHGAKFRTPSAIFVNGFLTVDGQKMSKSRGTFIKARTYLNHLPAEYLRYYFAAKLSDHVEDLDLNFDDFINRINADLVGKFVNIASRTANFISKYFNGKLAETIVDQELIRSFQVMGDEIAEKWTLQEYSQAIKLIMGLADRANEYINDHKPWSLVKDENSLQKAHDVCTVSLNLFRLLTIYLKPVLPETAKHVEALLNIAPLSWHDKSQLLLNHSINMFKPLLQRIDAKQTAALKQATLQDLGLSKA